MPAPFPITPELTAVAVAYHNTKMIADEVMPRVTVGKQEFKYTKFALEEGFTIPDTKVGRRSQPNEVTFSGKEVTDSTEDYGLDDPIPKSDIDNAKGTKFDPRAQSVQGITNLIELDREVRTAGMVFNAANYAAANKLTLAGTDQFSDFDNSDPIGTISDALDAMIMRATIMVIGRPAFSKLARHPEIIKAVHGNSGDSGIATRQAIAALFELEEILVGEAFLNTARKGQAANMQRVWGKHLALLHRDKQATNRQGTTFGFTAQFGGRVAGSKVDGNIGLFGGERVRAGESVKEVITATDLGFFIENAVG